MLDVPSLSTGPAGTLLFSTYIGGGVTASGQSETVQGVITDANQVHVCVAASASPLLQGTAGVPVPLFTTCDSAAEVLLKNVASPPYPAVIECVPTASVVVVNLATPPLNGPVLSVGSQPASARRREL